MSKLGIFVNRQTLSSSEQISAVIKCRDVAEGMGHTVEFIFPVDMKKIPRLDALFIRANTDPMNSTYVAARMAQMYGIPVIDDPESIKICADKINMYMHLMKNSISMPQTRFLNKKELDEAQAAARIPNHSELPSIVNKFHGASIASFEFGIGVIDHRNKFNPRPLGVLLAKLFNPIP